MTVAATVFAGFWFTYFGPLFAGNRAPDAALAHSRRMSLHRTLGGLSVALAAFYSAALLMRRRSDWHKRLMIIVSVGGMGAATFRLCMVFFGSGSV